MEIIVTVRSVARDKTVINDDGDEHHRVRVNLDGLCGDIYKSSESFCLQSNLLRFM